MTQNNRLGDDNLLDGEDFDYNDHIFDHGFPKKKPAAKIVSEIPTNHGLKKRTPGWNSDWLRRGVVQSFDGGELKVRDLPKAPAGKRYVYWPADFAGYKKGDLVLIINW